MASKVRFFNTVEPVNSFFRDLLPYLAKRGFSVEVLLSRARYREAREPLDEVLRGRQIEISYVTRRLNVKKSRLGRIVAILLYVWGSVWRSLVHSCDLNVFLTQPPLFHIWGVVLKKLRNQHYVCVVMDLYPDIAVKNGTISEKGLANLLFRVLSIYAFRQAAAVVAIGRCSAELLEERGLERRRIRVIPNWAEIPRTRAGSVQRVSGVREKWGVSTDDFVVLYSGNMGVCHDFRTILGVAGEFCDNRKVKFVFVGDGMFHGVICEAADNLPNVFVFPYEPWDALYDSLTAADIHFVTLRSGFEGLAVPSKAYWAFAVGRPVIYEGDERGEIARVIQEKEVGKVVPPGNVSVFCETIVEYLGNRALALEQGGRARRIVAEEFSSASAVRRYADLFENLLKEW